MLENRSSLVFPLTSQSASYLQFIFLEEVMIGRGDESCVNIFRAFPVLEFCPLWV